MSLLDLYCFFSLMMAPYTWIDISWELSLMATVEPLPNVNSTSEINSRMDLLSPWSAGPLLYFIKLCSFFLSSSAKHPLELFLQSTAPDCTLVQFRPSEAYHFISIGNLLLQLGQLEQFGIVRQHNHPQLVVKGDHPVLHSVVLESRLLAICCWETGWVELAELSLQILIYLKQPVFFVPQLRVFRNLLWCCYEGVLAVLPALKILIE